jgi:hypothetical protein
MTITAPSDTEIILLNWASFDLSQAAGRPITDSALSQAAGRLGVIVIDPATGRQALERAQYEQMKANYLSTGYYGPRRRGAPVPVVNKETA